MSVDRGAPRVALLALVAGAAAAWSCSTVDLGEPPADVNACRPSQQFFVERVFEEFLAVDYGGRSCGMAGCHVTGTGQIVLARPANEPTPTSFPLLPGSEWEALYLTAAMFMSCENPTASQLFAKPTELLIHGGQKLFDATDADGQAIGALLTAWVMP